MEGKIKQIRIDLSADPLFYQDRMEMMWLLLNNPMIEFSLIILFSKDFNGLAIL